MAYLYVHELLCVRATDGQSQQMTQGGMLAASLSSLDDGQADVALRVDLRPSSSFGKECLSGLMKLEAEALAAQLSFSTAIAACVDADRAADAAHAKAEELKQNLGKGAKSEDQDAASHARMTADEAKRLQDAAATQKAAAIQCLEEAQGCLLSEHTRLTSNVLVEESHKCRAMFSTVVAETHRTVTQVADEAIRCGTVEGAAKREAQLRCDEARAELQQMWSRIDPNIERDRKRDTKRIGTLWPEIAEGWNPVLVNGLKGFPTPAPVPGYVYPEHTRLPRRGPRLHHIARYQVGDRMLVHDASGSLTAARVTGVEFADAALPPRLSGKGGREAVYQLHSDSTSTTWARTAPKWVNETQLSPRRTGTKGLVGLRSAPGWKHIWPQGLSFEESRRRALLDLKRRAALETKEANEALQQRAAPHSMAHPGALTHRPLTNAAGISPRAPPMPRPASARESGSRTTRDNRAQPCLRRPHSATPRNEGNANGGGSWGSDSASVASPRASLRPGSARRGAVG